MTDEEIRKMLQRAFGYAPDQLVAELNRTRNELEAEANIEEEENPEA